PTSLKRWDRLAQDVAGEHGLFVGLTQLVGFEGGKGFPGGSIMADPHGEIMARAPLFQDAMLPVRVALDEISRARAAAPLLADLELKLPHLMESLEQRRQERAQHRASGIREVSKPSHVDEKTGANARATSCQPPSLEIDARLTRRWLVEFLRDEVTR